jgi:hypothetical protein
MASSARRRHRRPTLHRIGAVDRRLSHVEGARAARRLVSPARPALSRVGGPRASRRRRLDRGTDRKPEALGGRRALRRKRVEILAQRRGGLVAIVARGREQARGDGAKPRRHGCRQRTPLIPATDLLLEPARVGRVERRGATKQLVEDHAQGPEIRRFAHLLDV